MKFRIKYAQQVVGVFLLASVLALVVVLVFMGANQRWFARNYVFFSRFSTADGITTGMAVKLKGFEIGKVIGVELNSFNRVRVDVAIYQDYYTKIRPDSVLDLAVSAIPGLGGGSMNLLPGLNQLPPMEEGSFLPSSQSTLGAALMAQGLVDKPSSSGEINGIISQIEPLLIEVRATATGVTKLLGDINGAVEGKSRNEIAGLLGQAQAAATGVTQLLGNINGAVEGKADNQISLLLASSQDLLKKLNSITGEMEHLTSQMQDPTGLVPKLLDPKGSLKTLLDDKNELYGQLTGILAQVDKTLAQVTLTMSDLKGLTGYLNRSTPQISGLLEDTKTTLKKTGDVMEGLSNNPLLKGGIPEKKAQTSTLQGQRDESF